MQSLFNGHTPRSKKFKTFAIALLFLISSETFAANIPWIGFFGNSQNTSYLSASPNFEHMGFPYPLHAKDLPVMLSGRVAYLVNDSSFKRRFMHQKQEMPMAITAIDLSNRAETLWTHSFSNPLLSLTSSSQGVIETLEKNDKLTGLSLISRDAMTGKVLKNTTLLSKSYGDNTVAAMFSEGQHLSTLVGVFNDDEKPIQFKKLITVDADTHKMQLDMSFDLALIGMPAFHHQALYFLSDEYAYKISAKNGEILSQVAIPRCEESPDSCIVMVIDDDRVLYFNDDYEPNIIDYKTHEHTLWNVMPVADKPVIDNDNIYLSAPDSINAYDKKTLALKWSYRDKDEERVGLFAATDNAIILQKDYDGLVVLSKEGEEISLFQPIDKCLMPWSINEKAIVCMNMFGGIQNTIYPFNDKSS